MSWTDLTIGDAMVKRIGTVDPSKCPDEVFDLYSIPAYDRGKPDAVGGSRIGSTKQIVQPGDVLLSRIVPHIRRAWIVGRDNGRRLIASSEWIVFRSPHLDPGWLRHLLLSDRFHSQFMATVAGVGGSLLRARPAHVAQIRVSLPPLAEQRRIAAILDHADALKAKRHRVATELDDLLQAQFREAFGDVNANVLLSEIVEEFRYGTSKKSGSGGLPTLRIPNVVGGVLDTTDIKTVSVDAAEASRLSLADGDLLFVRTNGSPENVGRCAVYSRDAVATAGFSDSPWIYASYLIRGRLCSRFDPIFTSTYLASIDGRRQFRDRSKTSAGQYNINIEGIGGIQVPDVKLVDQQRFTSLACRIRSERTRLGALLEAHGRLFASLQSRAFRGEL